MLWTLVIIVTKREGRCEENWMSLSKDHLHVSLISIVTILFVIFGSLQTILDLMDYEIDRVITKEVHEFSFVPQFLTPAAVGETGSLTNRFTYTTMVLLKISTT